jgi:hypothetical protein
MSRPRHKNELARGAPPKALQKRSARVVYTNGDHASEYTLGHTGLGEFSLHWTAEWLAGSFCVSDFPTEWVTYVHAAFCGAWREAVWDHHGEATPFSAVTWELSPFERAVGPFSEVPLGVWLPHDALWANVDLDAIMQAEARTNAGVRRQLPLIRSLALPEPGGQTVDSE